MKFLVELDHPKTGQPLTGEAARAFIKGVIFPTLDRAEELVQEGRILAGGPVAGRISLRFIVDVESARQLDQLVTSIPLWSVADTRVTPLIEFGERRAHAQALLQPLGRTRPLQPLNLTSPAAKSKAIRQ
jgi:muconolactone delta-isomerase